jgi:hypothetical protein
MLLSATVAQIGCKCAGHSAGLSFIYAPADVDGAVLLT